MTDNLFTLETVKPLTVELLRQDETRVIVNPSEFTGFTGETYEIMTGACQYWDYDNDCPDCIVGRVLHALGISVPDVVKRANNSVTFTFIESVVTLFTHEAARFLRDVQELQDTGKSWGYIADRIEESHGRFSRFVIS